jgi:predicted amidohydrolase
MRIALATFWVTASLESNLREMDRMARDAASAGAQMILFPEAAPTGLLNNDDPLHDLDLSTRVPGPITHGWQQTARRTQAYIASGLLERDGSHLYDSAVLFSPDGELLLHYRRIQPQWHGAKADPAVYQQGDEISRAVTDFGRVVILICGDLFDDDICRQAKQHDPDLLLFPFARNFGDGSFDQQRWDREELGSYVARAARVGVTTAMVNGLVDPTVSEYPSFGGAWVVSSEGTVLAKRPLGQPGTLLFDLG